MLGDSKTAEVGCEVGNTICTIKTQIQVSTNKFCMLAAGHCTLLMLNLVILGDESLFHFYN